MNPNTVIAVCATAIAVASLVVSVIEARAARQHNRQSVRPILEFSQTWREGATAGLLLLNVGHGPGRVVRTELWVDGVRLGSFDKTTVDTVRDALPTRPRATTLVGRPVLPKDYRAMLLYVDCFDPVSHLPIEELINARLRVVIDYESLYNERFRVEFPETGLPWTTTKRGIGTAAATVVARVKTLLAHRSG
jgi:hypothetical protein